MDNLQIDHHLLDGIGGEMWSLMDSWMWSLLRDGLTEVLEQSIWISLGNRVVKCLK